MKIPRTNHKRHGFTRAELVLIIAVVSFLGFCFVSMLSFTKAHSQQMNCVNHLKQIQISFLTYAGDNGGRFPMQLLTDKRGGPLFTNSANAFRYYQVMSNELKDPKVLTCPADQKRKPAHNFNSNFASENVAFFTGLDASETNKDSFLSGDTNITNGVPAESGLLTLTTNQITGWSNARHGRIGNVLFSEGRVEQVFNSTDEHGLKEAIYKTKQATNRLLLP